MKKISKILIHVLVFMIFMAPLISLAKDLVPCGGKDEEMCDFPFLMILINRVVDFIFTRLVIPIAAILFAFAGIMLLTSGGDPGKKTKAKELFTGVAIGLVVAAAAWLIVNTILSILGYADADTWFNR